MEEADGTEEAGGHERGFLRKGADIGAGDALVRGEGGIAYDAVGPEVGDGDLEGVGAGCEVVGDIGLEGWCPEGLDFLAVEFDGGEFADEAEVEDDAACGFGSAPAEGGVIGGGAGVVLDAGIGMGGPVGEGFEGDGVIGAAGHGCEADCPWSGNVDEGFELGRVVC